MHRLRQELRGKRRHVLGLQIMAVGETENGEGRIVGGVTVKCTNIGGTTGKKLHKILVASVLTEAMPASPCGRP